jgi:hypothetical protein
MNDTSNNEGASKANPKLGVKFAWGPIGEKTNLAPYIYIYPFLSNIFILTLDFIPFGKTRAQYT